VIDYIQAPEAAPCQPVNFCWCGCAAAELTIHCRHKRGDCERCGTREGDAMHRTEGGRGVVARLRENR
jgi:hypothetical protein